MRQIRRLLKIVSFTLFCFVADVNSAQVNIAGCIYAFDQEYKPKGPYAWHQCPGNINGTHILTARGFKRSLYQNM